ncbi:hypothetical protein GDO81_023475, partial [Engystomops pustulosus]
NNSCGLCLVVGQTFKGLLLPGVCCGHESPRRCVTGCGLSPGQMWEELPAARHCQEAHSRSPAASSYLMSGRALKLYKRAGTPDVKVILSVFCFCPFLYRKEMFSPFSPLYCLFLVYNIFFYHPPGKRKALKLNFANPAFKSTAKFTLNPTIQPAHLMHKTDAMRNFETTYQKQDGRPAVTKQYSSNEQATKNRLERLRTHSIESSGKLKLSPEQHWDFTAEDLKDLGEIGRGAYGSVNKMIHNPSGQIMAVK